MAKKTAGKKGGDVINLTDDDYAGANFKNAPAGTYTVQIGPKSEIKRGQKGNNLNVHAVITKGPQKKITFFDTIAPHVGWKVAQLLNALGIKKKTLTLAELLKLIKGKELRVILSIEKYGGKKRNKVVQWLPLEAPAGEEAEDETDEDEDDDDDEDESDEEEEDDDDDEDDSDEDTDEDDDDSDDEDEEDEEDDAEEDEDEDEEEEDDDDDEDDEEDEEDDDEPAPPVKPTRAEKRAAAKKAAAPAPAKKKAVAKKAAPAKKSAAKKTGKKK